MTINLNKVYHTQFFHIRDKLAWRVPIVCNAICAVFKPKSVVDAGCAIGDYVAYFSQMGLYAKGIEGSESARDFIKKGADVFFWDLTVPLPVFSRFDVAMCLEVAEHIEAEFSGIFIDNLSYLSDTIVFTAAPPEQGGYGHVNCQPQSYWIEKFDNIGYNLSEAYVDRLRKQWAEIARERKEVRSYYNNLMVFRREALNG